MMTERRKVNHRDAMLNWDLGKRVTVVDYDLTSGSDNDDRDDDQSYIYCSIARPLSPGNRLRHDGDAQQRSDSDDCPPEIKRACLTKH